MMIRGQEPGPRYTIHSSPLTTDPCNKVNQRRSPGQRSAGSPYRTLNSPVIGRVSALRNSIAMHQLLLALLSLVHNFPSLTAAIYSPVPAAVLVAAVGTSA